MEAAQDQTSQLIGSSIAGSARPAGGFCKCHPVKVLRNKCLENNNGDEAACIDFVNAFKACVVVKKQERLAREAAEARQANTMI